MFMKGYTTMRWNQKEEFHMTIPASKSTKLDGAINPWKNLKTMKLNWEKEEKEK